MQIILNTIRRCLHAVDLTSFNILGQKFVKFFDVFLESLKHQKDILRLTDLYQPFLVQASNWNRQTWQACILSCGIHYL